MSVIIMQLHYSIRYHFNCKKKSLSFIHDIQTALVTVLGDKTLHVHKKGQESLMTNCVSVCASFSIIIIMVWGTGHSVNCLSPALVGVANLGPPGHQVGGGNADTTLPGVQRFIIRNRLQ